MSWQTIIVQSTWRFHVLVCHVAAIQNVIIFVFVVIVLVLILGFLFYALSSQIAVLYRRRLKSHVLKRRIRPRVISSPIPLSVNPYSM